MQDQPNVMLPIVTLDYLLSNCPQPLPRVMLSRQAMRRTAPQFSALLSCAYSPASAHPALVQADYRYIAIVTPAY